jgi:hypothetical protein
MVKNKRRQDIAERESRKGSAAKWFVDGSVTHVSKQVFLEIEVVLLILNIETVHDNKVDDMAFDIILIAGGHVGVVGYRPEEGPSPGLAKFYAACYPND